MANRWILGGINEGDEIVVSGQFLIDSESNLRASLMRATASMPTEQEAPAAMSDKETMPEGDAVTPSVAAPAAE